MRVDRRVGHRLRRGFVVPQPAQRTPGPVHDERLVTAAGLPEPEPSARALMALSDGLVFHRLTIDPTLARASNAPSERLFDRRTQLPQASEGVDMIRGRMLLARVRSQMLALCSTSGHSKGSRSPRPTRLMYWKTITYECNRVVCV